MKKLLIGFVFTCVAALSLGAADHWKMQFIHMDPKRSGGDHCGVLITYLEKGADQSPQHNALALT